MMSRGAAEETTAHLPWTSICLTCFSWPREAGLAGLVLAGVLLGRLSRMIFLGMGGPAPASPPLPHALAPAACERHFVDNVPSYFLPLGKVPAWMQLRQPRRCLVEWAWTEAFDKAFLGTVEGEALATGFGGIVRRATWAANPVVTKQMHRDPDDQELFKEVF